MNTSHIKSYAPQARNDFIAAVTKQAVKYGISADEITAIEIKGDVAIIGNQPFPASIAKAREALVSKVNQLGFQQVMEQVAYSWFNRLCAIRYMELKDYLGHGRRVLSHPQQDSGFQILEDCLEIDLPGLDQTRVQALKLDGSKDEELYRELLLAQCHALHQAMPFLFESIDDDTELLLPENLTKTDSLIRGLVQSIPEGDWQNIEIIGWLYQFYISEKKDEVIGKVVKSEDIPAATQLFTPNWIVKYMVQNSLGAQWLATYPDSPLKAQMEYYIEPAEQREAVNAQLAEITPSSLNPEELTLIDPASGSGHILVEAYDVFKAIYLERGYRQRDIAQLILEKNLYGLDIDERAAQLTGFALMMKARADDRRLFARNIQLNVMALENSPGFEPDALTPLLTSDLKITYLNQLKELFQHATTFGSLIQIPDELVQQLPRMQKLCITNISDLFIKEALNRLQPLVRQAQILAAQYDSVVANPPYMGSRGMNARLKCFVGENFSEAKNDLYTCFILNSCKQAKSIGRSAIVTLDSWMFLSSFERLRESLLQKSSIESLIHVGWNCFPQGHVYNRGVALVISNETIRGRGVYLNLSNVPATVDKQELYLRNVRSGEELYYREKSNFSKIPGSPLAFWIGSKFVDVFEKHPSLGEVVEAKQGIATADNNRFLRYWYEVSNRKVGFGSASMKEAGNSGKRWFPYNKGGDFRKWYGNQDYVIDWLEDGEGIKSFPKSVIRNSPYHFNSSVSWSDVTSFSTSFRWYPTGFLFDSTGHSVFPNDNYSRDDLLCLSNNNFIKEAIEFLNPTIHFHVGYFNSLPAAIIDRAEASRISTALINFSVTDWNAYVRSWDFQSLPILTVSKGSTTILEASYTKWLAQNQTTITEMQNLEQENNRLFIDAYGLNDELTPEVPIEQITLTVNPAYRYGGKLSEVEQQTRFREDTMTELVSYAIGCMMGRYSLDQPGLIYANSGNTNFDASRYTKFPADDDGIIPLTDKEWFFDDAANRLVEFISVAWPSETLEENLSYLASNLSPKKGEGCRDTIRRYLCDKFFKDHRQTYKKRPIYWLFSSGKQKAFQCLVYLHRYNEGTLARIRTEYVIPLTSKLASHVEKLEQDKDASNSTPEIKGLEKQLAYLHKQQAELSTFDEKLRHYADQRIILDLDDGVKVNYGKFGDLLAEVIAITGNKPT